MNKVLIFLTALASLIIALPTQAQIYITTTHLGGIATGKYDANTGVLINSNFIPVTGPMAASANNVLYIAPNNGTYGTVATYDATTGALLNSDFITGLGQITGIAVLGEQPLRVR